MMKKILLLFLLTNSVSFAQNTVVKIEKLTKPDKFLTQIPSQAIYNQFNIGLEASSKMPDSLVAFNEHPFLEGVVRAYQDHRPLTLSPDMFWILISQGFSRNVANNYEALRNQLVGFEGKKTLIVDGDQYHITPGDAKSQWEKVFPEFSNQIAGFTGKDLNDILTSDFSTTTSVSKAVSQITVMDAFKNYFDYKIMYTGCGLPYVTLEGNLGDWENLRNKAQKLTTYQLEWWTKEIIPILDKLIEAKKGKTDKDFWRNTVKRRTEKAPYGPINYIDGWITKFFPFDDKGKQRSLGSIYSSSGLASEVVKVPFILEDKESGKQHKMEILAGFLGLTQNKKDFGLKPELGWAINNIAKQKVKPNLSTGQKVRKLKITNVDEIPEAIFENNSYGDLTITFRGKISVPEKLTKISIDVLTLNGQISDDEKDRIIKLFPNTNVSINPPPSIWDAL